MSLLSGGPRIKLYKDDKNNLKGDALITYLKEESVTLACQLLDDTDLRPGKESKIRVQMVSLCCILHFILFEKNATVAH